MSRRHGAREYATVQSSSFSSNDSSDLSSILDTSADVSVPPLYPDLSAQKRDAARMDDSFDRALNQVRTESDGFTDGSGDHLPYNAEPNTSASSVGGESPGRVLRSSGVGSPRLRPKHQHVEGLVKGRRGIHENKVTPQQQQPSKRRPERAEPHQLQALVGKRMVIVSLLVVFILIVWYMRASEEKQENELVELVDERVATVERFRTSFGDLRAEFPSQSSRFWNILRAATEGVLSKVKPIRPAVILLASDNSSVDTALCVARRFATVVAASYPAPRRRTSMDCADFIGCKADEFKHKLHGTLEEGLSAGSKVAVVDNLQFIPGGASVVFHGYCDTENAPYLDVTFLLTLHMQDVVIYEADDAIVEDFLDRVWSEEVERENLAALYSRIANSIAFVNREEPDVIAKLCS